MVSIDETRLNRTEREALRTLSGYTKNNPAPTIVEAASICGRSVSYISKTVRKAGFTGYKQYIRCRYFSKYPRNQTLDELERLKHFLDDFDPDLVDEFAGLIKSHRKIILFGYGPSMICAQYIEYKLRFCTQAYVTTAPDEHSVRSMVDDESVLIIITATGRYRSFDAISRHALGRGAEVVVVSEELNPVLRELGGRYIFLSNHNQPDTLAPHEKTRTVFFIFFEQVVRRILEAKGRIDR
jgi:DNA-binding MurR/RpiR family transcriptional regulator